MKKIIILILFLLLVSSASAIGIAPSSKDVLSDQKTKFELKIINNQNQEIELDVLVPKQYSDAIIPSQKTVYLSSDDGYKKISVDVDANKIRNLAPGENKIKIQIKQKNSGSNNIGATINLEFYLKIIVPYEGAALKTQFLPSNFKSGEKGTFVVRAQNVGSEDIFNAILSVDIFTTTNQKIETVTSEKKSVGKGQTTNFVIPWIPDVNNGKYVAKATLIYNGKSETSEHIISVGKPEANIDSIVPNNYKLGGVAGFDLVISNSWAETIENVFAEVEFMKGNNRLNKVKSPSQNIEGFGKAVLPIYWDTANQEPGLYKMIINLNYLENTKTETFDIVMEQDQIKVGEISGRVTSKTESGGFDFSILVVLVIVILIINVLMFMKLRRKK